MRLTRAIPDSLLKYLLVFLVVLSMSDALLTHYLIEYDIASESNPFLAPFVGLPDFFVLKFFGVLLVAIIIWDIHRRHPKIALTVTSFAIAGYLIIVLWNLILFNGGW
jgi:hypothetical protein